MNMKYCRVRLYINRALRIRRPKWKRITYSFILLKMICGWDKVNSIVSRLSQCSRLTQSQQEFAVKQHTHRVKHRTLIQINRTQWYFDSGVRHSCCEHLFFIFHREQQRTKRGFYCIFFGEFMKHETESGKRVKLDRGIGETVTNFNTQWITNFSHAIPCSAHDCLKTNTKRPPMVINCHETMSHRNRWSRHLACVT